MGKTKSYRRNIYQSGSPYTDKEPGYVFEKLALGGQIQSYKTAVTAFFKCGVG
jgi:hypothetical protein